MMQRRTDLWGPDGKFIRIHYPLTLIRHSFPLAEVFDPDRWLDERLKTYVSKNPFIFLPFNAGPRICLGQQVNRLPRFPTDLLAD